MMAFLAGVILVAAGAGVLWIFALVAVSVSILLPLLVLRIEVYFD
jgi:hypothetical protein